MMFTQQTEATTCPTIEPTISRGVQLHEESACKPDRGAPSGNKNAETHGYYRRKIKLEAVSFEDLNFSSSGGEQLPKRFIELLNHCGGDHLVSAVRRRIIERVVFTQYQLDCLDLYLVEWGPADRQPMQAHIDPDRPRTRCSREHAEEAVRPDRPGSDQAADSDTRRVHGGYDESMV